MGNKVTTQSLRDNGHEHAVAWEAECRNCGQPCTTHTTTGYFPRDVTPFGGFWHKGCPFAHARQWRETP